MNNEQEIRHHMSLPGIKVLDVDGALREAEDAIQGDTRANFFRKAAVGGGAVVASGSILGMLPTLATAAPSAKGDLDILNYALTLEFLEAAFYKQAVKNAGASGDLQDFAKLVAAHEATHVTTLKAVIKKVGGKAVSEPKFDFGKAVTDADTFAATAFVLENTGVHAYLGQAANLQSKALLTAAATIVTIEARHAAGIAAILGNSAFGKGKNSITPDGAFDVPVPKGKILKAVGKTGFIKG
jgi:rubrerythrin